MASKIVDYSEPTQKLLLEYLISSETLYTQCQNIIKPKYWDTKYRRVTSFILKYTSEYNSLPTPDQIKAETKIGLNKVDNANNQSKWFLDTIENFCRHKAMELLIIDGPDLLEKGDYAAIETRSKENVMISLQKDIGTEYFNDPLSRLLTMKDKTNMTSTGWRDIDKNLYGGFNRGELTFFVGGPGCVTPDTIVRVMKVSTKAVFETEIQNLYAEVLKEDYYVESPDGWVKIVDCVVKPKKQIRKIVLENFYSVKASTDHLFQKHDGSWVMVSDLKIGDELITLAGPSKVGIIKVEQESIVYDLSVEHENHRYYTDGVSSHNTGKSLFLQNLALNWVEQGKNVLYISLELSEELVGLRFDAMITQMKTKEVFGNMEKVAQDVKLKYKFSEKVTKWGKLNIKKMPEAGTTVNDIRAYIKEYELQTGNKIDALCVDYLDLLYPNSKGVDINSAFNKDKYTSEELRALAAELNILCASASQLNRSSIQEQNFDASHIAGGISKINTADNVLGIFTNQAMKENGEYQIQFLKTRSSNGVGNRVYLKYNTDYLRITDQDDSDTASAPKHSGMAGVTQLLEKKKARTKETSKIDTDVIAKMRMLTKNRDY